jgi:hypothetical protein
MAYQTRYKKVRYGVITKSLIKMVKMQGKPIQLTPAIKAIEESQGVIMDRGVIKRMLSNMGHHIEERVPMEDHIKVIDYII